VTLQLGDLLL